MSTGNFSIVRSCSFDIGQPDSIANSVSLWALFTFRFVRSAHSNITHSDRERIGEHGPSHLFLKDFAAHELPRRALLDFQIADFHLCLAEQKPPETNCS
jgi:hypothetical protein